MNIINRDRLLGGTGKVGKGSNCDHCAVRHRAVCGALVREEIEQLNAIARMKSIPAGQPVLHDSEAPEFFANIVSGVIKLSKSLSDGRQQIVGLQFASDFLGRPWRRSSPFDATTVTDVTLCVFDRARFEALVKLNPALEHRMFESALDDLDSAREWLLLLGRKTAGEKVASLLRLIAQRSGMVGCGDTHGDGAAQFDLPLSRGEMADFLGLTIETVSRQFTRLKVAGIIELHGGRAISIPSLDRLDEACEVGD